MSESTKKQKSKFEPNRAHRYYKLTGFYSFVVESIKKSMPPVLIVVGILAVIHFITDDGIMGLLELAVEKLPDYGVLIFFYLSETFLGLIPPELFMGWAKATGPELQYINLFLLALCSYLGGFTSYWIGRRSLRISSLSNYLEVKMAKQLVMARKWGGILIAVGAMLPLPFSMASLVAGMLRYPIKNWILIGLLRFLRFAIYGYMVFQVV